MSKARAGAGSIAFLIVAPGVVAGLVPWLITGWSGAEWWPPVRVLGGLLALAGLAVLLSAFIQFVVEGVGTPAPIAPTEQLVVGGLYRYVRNPMYLAVAALIVGQALLIGQAVLLLYAAGVGASPSPRSCTATRSRCCRGASEHSTSPTGARCRRGDHG